MKTFKIATALLLVCTWTSSAQVLVSLGSSGFTVDSGSSVTYSQTATTLTFNSSITIGDNIFGLWNTTYNWSSYQTFALQFSVAGTNPNLPIAIHLFDTNYNIINEYSLSTNGVGSTATEVPLTLVSAGTGNLNAVVGFELIWAGSGTVNATFTNLVAVPEPSTWVLLIGAFTVTALCHRSRNARRDA